MASSSSSAASSDASLKGINQRRNDYAMEFSDELKTGEVIVPWRGIGESGPEKPVIYPTKWPAHIETAMKRRGDKPLRLYADGIFDLCHYGHFRALEQAKKSFPNTILIVGCCSDKDTHAFKGQTVMTQEERYETMRHCKWVDEVVIDAPWVIDVNFIEKHDIDFVCHDDLPYVDVSGASGCGDVYLPMKRLGKFHATQRTEGVSTSDLIIRIVKRYDDYVRRNLARGYSGAEMGVPFIKEKTLQLEMELGKRAAAASAHLHKWAEAAETVQYDFLQLFSHDGPIRTTIRQVADTVGSLLPKVGLLASPSGAASGAHGASSSGDGESPAFGSASPNKRRRAEEAPAEAADEEDAGGEEAAEAAAGAPKSSSTPNSPERAAKRRRSTGAAGATPAAESAVNS